MKKNSRAVLYLARLEAKQYDINKFHTGQALPKAALNMLMLIYNFISHVNPK